MIFAFGHKSKADAKNVETLSKTLWSKIELHLKRSNSTNSLVDFRFNWRYYPRLIWVKLNEPSFQLVTFMFIDSW